MRILIFFLLLICSGELISQTKTISIHQNWQFKKSTDTAWLPAIIPGTIHTDLLANKKIPDPFWGTNEKELRWIEDADWEYQSFFSIDEEIYSHHHIELEFEGLDTYAKVFLNDSLILTADNMFRTWIVDVKKYIRKKDNRLMIRFESAVRKGKELVKQLPYTLPGDEKVFTRKAQYHYGWDWGPRFVTCGVWRPVKLHAWDEIKIESIRIRQDTLNDDYANLHAVFEIISNSDMEIQLEAKEISSQWVYANKNFSVHAGRNSYALDFTIKYPKKWWCNGAGESGLYHFVFSAIKNNKQLNTRELSFGLRTIELIREPDSIGKSFSFRINGVPVFMKGANWIPADNFLPRVSKDKYRQLLLEAKNANMNMLRVWGGGIYESDDFYSLCDSLGILVWQDFMFACAMYPGDSAFVNNVKAEVIDNVKRLRNHPCIALWCGNNEIDEGWKNWGWQKQYNYSQNDSAKIWNDYLKVFHQLIPSLLDSLLSPSPFPSLTLSLEPEKRRQGETENYYVTTSPHIGWGHKESLEQGDSHYWGVWWGMEPFDTYEKKVGRFMSEYGFQGMPSLNTFRKFCMEKDLALSSNPVKNHQKHPTGYETIQKYLERDYKQPIVDSASGGKDFESYIYVSQLLQAEGMKTAIEAHRCAKPRCMGTLYWQLNDCWPVTSWSSLDYYGNKKALHYTVKKAYSKFLISAQINNENLVVTAVSDEPDDTRIKFRVQLFDFTGNRLWADSGNITLSHITSNPFYPLPLKDLTSNISVKRTYFKMELMKNDSVVADNIYYFVKPKDLLLDRSHIEYTLTPGGINEFKLVLSTTTLAKNVCIDFNDLNILLSDNFFDLPAKEKKIVYILFDGTRENLEEKIKIRSLIDSFE